jgi:L-lactate dehydrogenase (cytochrome)
MKRRFPGFKELSQLIHFRKPIWNGRKRRLARALTIYDLRSIAKRRTPRAPFDYTDGAADSEASLSRARLAFEQVEFHPRVRRNVSNVDLSTLMLGRKSTLPFGIAPTGFTRMMQTEGENAGCTAARDAGIPFALSTMGTRSIEDVAVAGARLRDVRNGMTIPPSLSLRTIGNAIPRPAWWINFLTTDSLKFASLDSWNGTVAELLDSMFDPTVTYEDLKWIRQQWSGNLVVKGIQNIDDAAMAIEAGANAIILSNHGGRQLDRAPVPIHLLPEIVKEVGGRAEIHVDTGIMHGGDIVTALANGATFTWIGRAYLYGLMARGKESVDRSIEILRSQMVRTMKSLGVKSLSL